MVNLFWDKNIEKQPTGLKFTPKFIPEADNFQTLKYGISLVLEENELDTYIIGEVPVPEGDEAKSLTQEELGQGQEDHLIPQLSSLKTPKEMFDSQTKLFDGKNINQKKYRNSVILEEIDLDQYFSKEVIIDFV